MSDEKVLRVAKHQIRMGNLSLVTSILSTVTGVLSAGAVGALCTWGAVAMKKANLELTSNLLSVLCILIAVVGFLVMIVMIVGGWIEFLPLQLCGLVFAGLFALVFGFGFYVAMYDKPLGRTLIGLVWGGEIFQGVHSAPAAIEASYQCCGWDIAAERCSSLGLPTCEIEFIKAMQGDICLVVGIMCMVVTALCIATIVLRLMIICGEDGAVENSPFDDEDCAGHETEAVPTRRTGRQTHRSKAKKEVSDEYESEEEESNDYEYEYEYEDSSEPEHKGHGLVSQKPAKPKRTAPPSDGYEYEYEYEESDTPPPNKRRR